MTRDPNQFSLFPTAGDSPSSPVSDPPRRRNVILEAGAGTGKTTAIVIRVVELLLLEPDLDPREIVLITFTEKAAAEIADRIREALIGLRENLERGDPTIRTRGGDALWAIPVPLVASVTETLAVQMARIDYLESQTIHSFCQGLLKRFPIEAHLDPRFEIIQGFDLDHFHNEAFRSWLVEEMKDPEHRDDWVRLYAHFRYLDRIREQLFNLLSRRDLILDPSLSLGEIVDYDQQVRAWIGEARRFDAAMIDSITYDPNRAILTHLRAATPPPSGSIEGWAGYFRPIEEDLQNVHTGRAKQAKELLDHLRGRDKKSLGRRVTVAEILRHHEIAESLRAVASRFFVWLRDEMDRRGIVDFDELLYRTNNLLDDDAIRSRVRNGIRFIFVDEFQDTDRVQAAIVRKLATDELGALIPGRTVIVGDPKQSIYSFRRADPELFESMCRELQTAGASRDYLDRQFRSEETLLENFNLLFADLFGEPLHEDKESEVALRDMLATRSRWVFQPNYQRLEAPRSNDRCEPRDARFHFLRVKTDDEASIETGEATAVARWIDNARASGEPLDRFVILLRKMTRVQDFIEVLEARGIPCQVPSSRSFLDQPAAIDLLTVLRTIAFPFDRGASISAARTPWFALSDDEIVTHLLDLPHEDPCAWRSFETEAERYRELARFEPVSQLIERLIAEREIELPYTSLIGGHEHLAHLDRLRDLALRWDIDDGGSIREFVDEMTRRRQSWVPNETPPDEQVSSGFVRIMTVHAAKGLEFDTVILPDLAPTLGGSGMEVGVIDPIHRLVFRRGLFSLSAQFPLLDGQTPEGILRQRDEAEEQRLFYVALTRAKSRVVFAIHERLQYRAFWRCLVDPLGLSIATLGDHWPEPGDPSITMDFPIRSSSIRIAFHSFGEEIEPGHEPSRFVHPRLAESASLTLEPSNESRRTPERAALDREEVAVRLASSRRRLDGLLLHRMLETWNEAPDSLAETLHRHALELAADKATIERVRRRLEYVCGSPTFRRLHHAETIGREITIHHRDEDRHAVRSRIDRLIRENGELRVIDYKTGSRTSGRARSDDEQVRRYCRAVEELTGEPCGGLLWYIDIDSDEIVDIH